MTIYLANEVKDSVDEMTFKDIKYLKGLLHSFQGNTPDTSTSEQFELEGKTIFSKKFDSGFTVYYALKNDSVFILSIEKSN